MNMAHKEKGNSSSCLSFGRRRGPGYLLENEAISSLNIQENYNLVNMRNSLRCNNIDNFIDLYQLVIVA